MLEFDLDYRRAPFRLHAQATLDAQVTGIHGASGAGKSTLLALIAGLIRPHAGWLRIDGDTLVDVAAQRFVPPWKRHVGLVFQDGQLFPHLSVRRNLLYGHARLRADERRIRFDDVVDLLEIAPLLQRRPAQLSGGERQRVALGRALLYSPRLLLLDEPLSSLDERLKQQILPFLGRVKATLGTRMLYVSHVRAEIDAIADAVLEMHAGRLGSTTDNDAAWGRGAGTSRDGAA